MGEQTNEDVRDGLGRGADGKEVYEPGESVSGKHVEQVVGSVLSVDEQQKLTCEVTRFELVDGYFVRSPIAPALDIAVVPSENYCQVIGTPSPQALAYTPSAQNLKWHTDNTLLNPNPGGKMLSCEDRSMVPITQLGTKLPPFSDLQDSGKREDFSTGAVREEVDVEKGRMDLLSPFPIFRAAVVAAKGAKKYSDRNWEKGLPLHRYMDSLKRHIAKYEVGQTDEDHLGHALWNLMALMHTEEMIRRGKLPKELDTLPKYNLVLHEG